MSWIDEHNNSSIDTTKLTSVTAASGTIVEGTEYVAITTSADTDAGLLFYKNPADFTKKEFFSRRLAVSATNGNAYFFIGLDQAAAACGTTVGAGAQIRIVTYQDNTGALGVAYKNAAGTWQYWNESTPGWQAPAATIARTLGEYFVVQFIKNTTQWKIIVLDGSGSRVLVHTTWVNFSDTLAISNSLFIATGDPFTDSYTMTISLDFTKYGDSTEIVSYFNGYDASTVYSIGRALSWNDGADFFHEPKAAVIAAADFPGAANIVGCKDPCCVLDSGTYYLFCSGYIVAGTHSIWLFTSSDGITFTVSGTAAKIPINGGGIDASGCEFPRVIKSNGTWHIYYAGDIGGAVNTSINYCETTNPIEDSYTKLGSLLGLGAAGQFDDTQIILGSAIYDNTLKKVRLYYSGQISTGFFKIGVASSDTFSYGFSKDATNPILSYSTKTATITGQTGRVLDVNSTTGWSAFDWSIMLSSADAYGCMNRIEAVDSSTRFTLSAIPVGGGVGGKIKSAYYNKVFPANIRKVSDSDWELCVIGFGQKDDKGFAAEVSGHAVGTDYKTFTLAENKLAPLLPMGKIGTWNSRSSENLIFIGEGIVTDSRMPNMASIPTIPSM